MKFNINDYVKVRLTGAGRRHLFDAHCEFWERYFPQPEYVPPDEDENGWSKWRLWVLMDKLGACFDCGEPPLEDDIEICEEPEQCE